MGGRGCQIDNLVCQQGFFQVYFFCVQTTVKHSRAMRKYPLLCLTTENPMRRILTPTNLRPLICLISCPSSPSTTKCTQLVFSNNGSGHVNENDLSSAGSSNDHTLLEQRPCNGTKRSVSSAQHVQACLQQSRCYARSRCAVAKLIGVCGGRILMVICIVCFFTFEVNMESHYQFQRGVPRRHFFLDYLSHVYYLPVAINTACKRLSILPHQPYPISMRVLCTHCCCCCCCCCLWWWWCWCLC